MSGTSGEEPIPYEIRQAALRALAREALPRKFWPPGALVEARARQMMAGAPGGAPGGAPAAPPPDANVENCVICQEPLNNGQPIYTGRCSHKLHTACREYMHTGGLTACPLCRIAGFGRPRRTKYIM